MKKSLIIIMMFLLVVCGCSNEEDVNKTKIVNHSLDNTSSTILTSSEINEILGEDNYIILDVRTIDEYNETHIIDSVNIPYDEIDENIELDKNKTILVYCKSGKRASTAVNTLTKLGYTAYNMGGIDSIDIDKE